MLFEPKMCLKEATLYRMSKGDLSRKGQRGWKKSKEVGDGEDGKDEDGGSRRQLYIWTPKKPL